MPVAVEIPDALRAYATEYDKVEIEASTIVDALIELKAEYPRLYTCICDETGAVRPNINLFVNQEIVADVNEGGLRHSLSADDKLTIWTAVSGG